MTTFTTADMRQIDVDIKFNDETDEPTFFVSEDGNTMWRYDDTVKADWKDHMGQQAAVEQLDAKGGETVILFDGSDTMIFASMNDAIEC